MDSPVESVATAMWCLFLGWIGRNAKLVARLEKESRRVILLVLAGGVTALVGVLLEQEAQAQQQRNFIEAAVTEVYTEFWNNNSKKRRATAAAEGEIIVINGKKKRRCCKHDHSRAWMCIQRDYLGLDPIFTDKQFEEVYRLTKGAVEKLINACCTYEPGYFFTDRFDCAGKRAIRVECKILGILKCVAFGCSGVAFRDYHQNALSFVL